MVFTRSCAIARYLKAPLLSERESYLRFLVSQGRSREKLRDAAGYMNRVIEQLKLKNLRPFTVTELRRAAHAWSRRNGAFLQKRIRVAQRSCAMRGQTRLIGGNRTMAVYRRGKTWWYVFEFEGRRIQESSGFRNKTAALRAEAKRRTDLLERRAGFTKLKQAPKFEEFVEQFLRWSEQQHRPKTHELHSGNCKALKSFFRGKWLDEITQGMVEDFKLTRIKQKRWGERDEVAVSGVTVNRALSTMRLIYNQAERCGFRVSNPVKHVVFFRETGRTRIISPQEERAYLAATSQPLRDIARTMLDTGMRPEEVFRIEIANLDFVQCTILNPFGKTAAARRKLTMTEEVWSLLKARTVSAKGLYVFSSPDKPEKPIGSVRKAHNAAICRAKIVPGFRLYDLRHTYASRAVMAGVDLPTLAALLGHTSVQMTKRYVHPAEEHKRNAAAKIEKFKMASAIELASRSQGVTTKVTTVERVQ